MPDKAEVTRLAPDELVPALLEKIAALSPDELSVIVLAASQALGDVGCKEALAEECSRSVDEIRSLEDRVFYDGQVDPGGDDYNPPEQDDLVTIALRIQRELKSSE